MKKHYNGHRETKEEKKVWVNVFFERPVALMFRQIARGQKKTYTDFMLELLKGYRKSK